MVWRAEIEEGRPAGRAGQPGLGLALLGWVLGRWGMQGQPGLGLALLGWVLGSLAGKGGLAGRVGRGSQGLAWLCWAGSWAGGAVRGGSAGKAEQAGLGPGQVGQDGAGLGLARLGVGQVGLGWAGLGLARLGVGQAGAWLGWAGSWAGWGWLGVWQAGAWLGWVLGRQGGQGRWGRQGQPGLGLALLGWVLGRAGWGLAGLGPRQVGQSMAGWLARAGWQAGQARLCWPRSWAGREGRAWLGFAGLGPGQVGQVGQSRAARACLCLAFRMGRLGRWCRSIGKGRADRLVISVIFFDLKYGSSSPSDKVIEFRNNEIIRFKNGTKYNGGPVPPPLRNPPPSLLNRRYLPFLYVSHQKSSPLALDLITLKPSPKTELYQPTDLTENQTDCNKVSTVDLSGVAGLLLNKESYLRIEKDRNGLGVGQVGLGWAGSWAGRAWLGWAGLGPGQVGQVGQDGAGLGMGLAWAWLGLGYGRARLGLAGLGPRQAWGWAGLGPMQVGQSGAALGLAFLSDRESFSKSSYSLWRKSPLGNCTFMWTNLISQEEIITTNEEVNFQPLGSLLADDMGLGKMLQAIALISSTLPSLQQYKDEDFINISS
ncbi:hypothetical protein BY996DRAFT_6599568 [Phakopsora pachyrhizi]|nr:hypothetical protein BY996DRAFT_6599568 [Phakopsora pachyrhizi]